MSTPATDLPRGRLATLRRRYEPQLTALKGSETAKAVGLAAAMIVNNVIALASTVVFARLLNDYGSLAALVSYFLILSVAGQAIQVATAREGVLGHLGTGEDLLHTMRRWTRSMIWVTVVLTVISILARHAIADAVGVKHDSWAAAVGLPAGCVWIELSILRGALQGVGDYRSVGFSLIGEQSTRLIAGTILVVAGLGVTGAFVGTPISLIAMSVYCARELRRRTREIPAGQAAVAQAAHPALNLSLRSHVMRAWAPIAGLIVIAVLQNIDIIAAKHRFNGTPELASSYAATAVAAKVLIWVAIGAGFHLVPEVSRRQAEGRDTRPVLLQSLAIIFACAVPVLLIFAFGAHPLLRAAFGPKRLRAESSLFVLGLAFSVLACTYLAIQYMLALKRTWFLIVLGLVAVAEPILLFQASKKPTGFAAIVLTIQGVGAVLAFTLALKRDSSAPPAPATSRPEPA